MLASTINSPTPDSRSSHVSSTGETQGRDAFAGETSLEHLPRSLSWWAWPRPTYWPECCRSFHSLVTRAPVEEWRSTQGCVITPTARSAAGGEMCRKPRATILTPRDLLALLYPPCSPRTCRAGKGNRAAGGGRGSYRVDRLRVRSAERNWRAARRRGYGLHRVLTLGARNIPASRSTTMDDGKFCDTHRKTRPVVIGPGPPDFPARQVPRGWQRPDIKSAKKKKNRFGVEVRIVARVLRHIRHCRAFERVGVRHALGSRARRSSNCDSSVMTNRRVERRPARRPERGS